jgi:hypothetical protein
VTVWAARAAWLLTVVVSVVCFVVSVPGFVAHLGPGPLADGLAASGLVGAQMVASGLEMLGVLVRTVVFVGCAGVLARVGWSQPLPLVLSASLVAYAVGLGLSDGTHPPLTERLFEVVTLVVIAGLALATQLLPSGRFYHRGAAVFAALWVALAAFVLQPAFFPWTGLPQPLNLQVQLGLLTLGVASMGLRFARFADPFERQQLRWVLFGFVVGVVGLAARVVLDLPPAAAEFHEILLYPVAVCVAPFAITASVFRYRVWDLPILVRHTTVAFVWVLGAATLALLFARIVPGLLSAMGLHPDASSLPAWSEPALIAVLAVGVSALGARLVARLTDMALFPVRLRAVRALAEVREALEDCWDPTELAWCARAGTRLAFGSPGGWVVRHRDGRWFPLRGDDATAPLDELALEALQAGSPWDVDDGDGTTVWVPLHSHDELVGALVVPGRPGQGLSSAEREVLEDMQQPFADALWRSTSANRA